MAELSKSRPVARPGANMRLIEALQYRLPLAALVSILHRASGMLMFFLLPFIVWMFDASVTSEISYDGFTSAFVAYSQVKVVRMRARASFPMRRRNAGSSMRVSMPVAIASGSRVGTM